MNNMRKSCCWVGVGATILLPACTSTGRNDGVTVQNGDAAARRLASRAEQLWTARVAEDWKSAFEYYEPETRAQLVREDFEKWSQENQPFRIHSYRVGLVDVDGDSGWVQIDYRTTLRRFPNIPERDAVMWQKWRQTSGEWYPIPEAELASYPEPPAIRDRSDEQALRARFEDSWKGRSVSDWHAVYQFVDPDDRDDVTEAMFSESEGLFRYLKRDVRWIEAIDGFGRVCVVYTHSVTDPQMQKLPARDLMIIEKWMKSPSDGQWYRNLK